MSRQVFAAQEVTTFSRGLVTGWGGSMPLCFKRKFSVMRLKVPCVLCGTTKLLWPTKSQTAEGMAFGPVDNLAISTLPYRRRHSSFTSSHRDTGVQDDPEGISPYIHVDRLLTAATATCCDKTSAWLDRNGLRRFVLQRFRKRLYHLRKRVLDRSSRSDKWYDGKFGIESVIAQQHIQACWQKS